MWYDFRFGLPWDQLLCSGTGMRVVRRKRVMYRMLCELQVHFVNGIVMYQFSSCIFTWLEVNIVDLKQLLELEYSWHVVSICEL